MLRTDLPMWMPFQKKYERARRFQREQMGLSPEEEACNGEGAGDESMPEIEQPSIREQMEKGDMGAMLLSAFLTLFLPCILIIGIMVLLAFWIFGIL